MWILAGAGILIILVGGNLILQMSERRNESYKVELRNELKEHKRTILSTAFLSV